MAAKSRHSTGNCSSDYFRPPYLTPVIIFLVVLFYQGMTTFAPNQLPNWLWPLGPFGRYMGNTYPGFMRFSIYGTIALHIFETGVVLITCRRRQFSVKATYKWAVSTFFFGYLSLYLLRKLHPWQNVGGGKRQ